MEKERLNSSLEKNKASTAEGRWRNPVTFLLCDPGWYNHKPDVQNKWDDNIHTHIYTSNNPWTSYSSKSKDKSSYGLDFQL